MGDRLTNGLLPDQLVQWYPYRVGDHQQRVQSRGMDSGLNVDDRVPAEIDHLTEAFLGEVGVQPRVSDLLPDPPTAHNDVIWDWI